MAQCGSGQYMRKQIHIKIFCCVKKLILKYFVGDHLYILHSHLGVPGNFEKLVEISSFQSFRYERDGHNFIMMI
jgi:hypothetical protein